MNALKRRARETFMTKTAVRVGLLIFLGGFNALAQMTSSDGVYTMTKDLPGPTGANLVVSLDGSLEMGFSFGEQLAAPGRTVGIWTLFPGYYSGGNSGAGTNLLVLNVLVAPGVRTYTQDALQVGVPVNAVVTVSFSDQIDSGTAASGIQVYKLQDHSGNLISQPVAIQVNPDPLLQSVTISPSGAWEGNSLYAVVVSSAVRSLDGNAIDTESRTLYLTVLDPKQENLLFQFPNANSAGTLSAGEVVASGGMTLNLPEATLADFAAILTSKDPVNAPLRVDAKIVAEATRKAQAASPYRIPLLVREITGFDSQGNTITHLAKPVQFTLGMHDASAGAAPTAAWIRPQTLSLWTLDEDHQLWLKMPDSQATPDGSGMTAPVTSLAVFALMGDASGNAANVFPFPVPWRPHGPQAGTGIGQTGTDDAAGGITFADLPSECKIRIFTLTGELVREIIHSDITSANQARERWDVKTTHGQAVASGVYFWRVESATDSKNGKLMVIR
jgi:Bacterial Ig-like domain